MGVSLVLLSMWVIYDHPRDMPDHIVARRHEMRPTGESIATRNVILGDTVPAVRAKLPPGLSRLPVLHPLDDPAIVEVWL